jgi:hypothetical protein
MFIGHYSAAFAARAFTPKNSENTVGLGLFFVAAQAVDIGFFSLVGMGVEHARHNPSLTGIMPIDLYHMPFTHSLPATVIWAVIGGYLGSLLFKAGQKRIAGVLIGLVIASHWFLDLPMHRPDLGLWWDHYKVGFGLWNHPAAAMGLELLVFGTALALYLRKRGSEEKRPALPLLLLLGFLAFGQAVNWFGPPATNTVQFVTNALLAYGVAAALALWADMPLKPKPAAAP